MSTITPCLWFDTEALDAAKYYASLFPNSEIKHIGYYDESNPYGTPGSVMIVVFSLDGNMFHGLNGGPVFKHSPAVSFVVPCQTQDEVDRYWSALSAVPEAEECGWVCDRFGISWQIIPNVLMELLAKDTSGRVMRAMLGMKKLNIADLEAAYNG